MKLQLDSFALLAILVPLGDALPSDAVASELAIGDKADLVVRQVPATRFSCNMHPPHRLGECNNAIADLRRRELRGCNVWGCISAWAGVIGACGAAFGEFGANPIADLGCFGAVTGWEGACNFCDS
ncbi:hypothetical protein BS50DRAFT_646036 [Corynespora cassiicola Philippines]|uniref:Fungal calcium binding protein domain-containing protein n=1 Tax=Corynespora cassiicola Philippines TaxID=1448308 RepID=A0A2T2MZN6_CORCC|nr:hypothetical protein BS50DRAFT_646036 [Corynespora cassiicola Philippines]